MLKKIWGKVVLSLPNQKFFTKLKFFTTIKIIIQNELQSICNKTKSQQSSGEDHYFVWTFTNSSMLIQCVINRECCLHRQGKCCRYSHLLIQLVTYYSSVTRYIQVSVKSWSKFSMWIKKFYFNLFTILN